MDMAWMAMGGLKRDQLAMAWMAMGGLKRDQLMHSMCINLLCCFCMAMAGRLSCSGCLFCV